MTLELFLACLVAAMAAVAFGVWVDTVRSQHAKRIDEQYHARFGMDHWS